jgi:RND family efflux transporter MFP subunit
LNNETRTLMARAEIQNRDDILRPGMSFDVRWEIKGDSYPTVPEIALQWGRDGSFVWVIRDGVAKSVPGRVVSRKAGLVLIDGDIRAGEDVVVEGVQRLRDGDKVTRLNGSDNG